MWNMRSSNRSAAFVQKPLFIDATSLQSAITIKSLMRPPQQYLAHAAKTVTVKVPQTPTVRLQSKQSAFQRQTPQSAQPLRVTDLLRVSSQIALSRIDQQQQQQQIQVKHNVQDHLYTVQDPSNIVVTNTAQKRSAQPTTPRQKLLTAHGFGSSLTAEEIDENRRARTARPQIQVTRSEMVVKLVQSSAPQYRFGHVVSRAE